MTIKDRCTVNKRDFILIPIGGCNECIGFDKKKGNKLCRQLGDSCMVALHHAWAEDRTKENKRG